MKNIVVILISCCLISNLSIAQTQNSKFSDWQSSGFNLEESPEQPAELMNRYLPDSTRSFVQDLELMKMICQCDGLLSPFIIQSALSNGYSVSDLLLAGASTSDMLAGGVSEADLVNGGASISSLINSGADLSALINAGVTISELLNAGAKILDLIAEGVTITQLINGGASVEDMLAAGVTEAQLLNGGVTIANLISAGGSLQAILDNGNTPFDLVNGGASLSSVYGLTYESGLIFYINMDSLAGLAASPIELNTVHNWGCNSIYLAAFDFNLGTGQINTDKIEFQCPTPNIAADVCANYSLNGINDWFLPSINELRFMHDNLHLETTGEFIDGAIYWSSTEVNNTESKCIKFGGGSFLNRTKNNLFRVRPTRIFR